jgi:hypothetical protein
LVRSEGFVEHGLNLSNALELRIQGLTHFLPEPIERRCCTYSSSGFWLRRFALVREVFIDFGTLIGTLAPTEVDNDTLVLSHGQSGRRHSRFENPPRRCPTSKGSLKETISRFRALRPRIFPPTSINNSLDLPARLKLVSGQLKTTLSTCPQLWCGCASTNIASV